jgi:hypothetical protein
MTKEMNIESIVIAMRATLAVHGKREFDSARNAMLSI